MTGITAYQLGSLISRSGMLYEGPARLEEMGRVAMQYASTKTSELEIQISALRMTLAIIADYETDGAIRKIAQDALNWKRQ